MNIVLCCGNLSYAGAQRQLLELAKGLNQNHNVVVCSISSKVPLLKEFQDNKIKVEVLGLRKRNTIRILKRMYRILKTQDTDILYSYLETANTYSRLIKVFVPSVKVISSERSSDTKTNSFRKFFEIFLFKLTNLYIANSNAGKIALWNNYKISNVKVVYNGVDTLRFNDLKKSTLGVNLKDKILVCQIGRIKPDKNYEMFLEVANRVCSMNKNIIFVAIGDQPNLKDSYQDTIFSKRETLEFKDRILFIGTRSDIPEILSETDISMLTSHREGCSNTVLESMFSKCPLVLTDVGDNRIIISELNTNFLVPPDDVEAMASKIVELANSKMLRTEIGLKNFEKAHRDFSRKKMVENTEKIMLDLE